MPDHGTANVLTDALDQLCAVCVSTAVQVEPSLVPLSVQSFHASVSHWYLPSE